MLTSRERVYLIMRRVLIPAEPDYLLLCGMGDDLSDEDKDILRRIACNGVWQLETNKVSFSMPKSTSLRDKNRITILYAGEEYQIPYSEIWLCQKPVAYCFRSCVIRCSKHMVSGCRSVSLKAAM